MAPAAGTKRRSARQAASRRRSVYVDPDTDDDFEMPSDDDDRTPELRAEHAPPAKRPRSAPRPTPRPSRRQTRSKSTAQNRRNGAPRLRPIGAPRLRRGQRDGEHTAPSKAFKGPSDGKTPPWTSLPVDILREVFLYAALPLLEQTRTASDNASWLIKAARTCRAFALPALEAFYLAPPIHTEMEPHRLLELLRVPLERRYMDYNVKVKALFIDVRRLAYTAHNKPLFDLSQLVAELPQLQHLELEHPADKPPFRPMKVQSWRYPLALFPTLEQHGHRLKSWRWDKEMITGSGTSEACHYMARAHAAKSFERLERLVVCGFGRDPYDDGGDTAASSLASAITVLPNLKDLTFISCHIVMDKLLERLPRDLRRLEITNCLELTSDILKAYVAMGGAQLRELVLNHNTSLSLTFLPRLKMSCPRLEFLTMDLKYFSERMNSNDAEPLYDELLSVDDVPTWPSTLRHLELVQLQRWPAEAAQNLFRSLIDNAADLPQLRYLVLQAHIDIPWRDRAGFRDQWIERLQRVYLRHSEPPNPILGSLRQYRLWKQTQATGRAPLARPNGIINGVNADDGATTGREMLYAPVSSAKSHSGDTDAFSDSAPSQRRPMRRSKRVAENHASHSAAPPPVDSDSTESDDSNVEDWRKQPERHIQGLCDVVDIRIDNQRPRENQWTENDFLDSEASGDEDWHEGADVSEEDGYAW